MLLFRPGQQGFPGKSTMSPSRTPAVDTAQGLPAEGPAR